VTATAVLALGILIWILMAIPVALFVARMTRLTSPRALAIELSPGPPVGKPVPDPTVEAIAGFPAEPTRFVGRAEAMAAAGTALAPACGRSAVVFHGMAGAGKTTCAVELAYRHQRGFGRVAFWSAPTEPDQCGDALRLLAMELEAQLGDHGVAMVEEIVTLERLEKFLPTSPPSSATRACCWSWTISKPCSPRMASGVIVDGRS
jgi:hypothetical protein